ncbi:hypothetical protein M5K25_012229 [Dendrobium thyrsiflorum]|uniref:Uncharacterized protein n=1 Tax=Dendrobium thyrsiflorum TaxID=117978 RepID=A0ABD0V3M5_DENTH
MFLTEKGKDEENMGKMDWGCTEAATFLMVEEDNSNLAEKNSVYGHPEGQQFSAGGNRKKYSDVGWGGGETGGCRLLAAVEEEPEEEAFEAYNNENSLSKGTKPTNPILCRQGDRVDKVQIPTKYDDPHLSSNRRFCRQIIPQVNVYDWGPLNQVVYRQMTPLNYDYGQHPYAPQWHKILEI